MAPGISPTYAYDFRFARRIEKSAKIAAVKRGSTLRDLVAEGLRRVLKDEPVPERKSMTEPPVKLPPGHTIPLRSNREIAQMFEQENIATNNDVYRGR